MIKESPLLLLNHLYLPNIIISIEEVEKINKSLELKNSNRNVFILCALNFLVLRILAQIILAIMEQPAKPVSQTKGIVVCVLQDIRVRLVKVVRNMSFNLVY